MVKNKGEKKEQQQQQQKEINKRKRGIKWVKVGTERGK